MLIVETAARICSAFDRKSPDVVLRDPITVSSNISLLMILPAVRAVQDFSRPCC